MELCHHHIPQMHLNIIWGIIEILACVLEAAGLFVVSLDEIPLSWCWDVCGPAVAFVLLMGPARW